MHSSHTPRAAAASLLALTLALSFALLAPAGCDDPDILYAPEAGLPTSDGGLADAGHPADASEAGPSDAAQDAPVADAQDDAPDGDAGAGTVNGCTSFVDLSAPSATRQIDFPNGANPAQYNPPCIQIAVGQDVTFAGAFMHHPLEPFGGDANSPITATSTGTTAQFTFGTAGTFGFHCAMHPSIMFGAVLVQ